MNSEQLAEFEHIMESGDEATAPVGGMWDHLDTGGVGQRLRQHDPS